MNVLRVLFIVVLVAGAVGCRSRDTAVGFGRSMSGDLADAKSHSQDYAKPFFFRVQDASTSEPLPYFTVYWTESWQETGTTMPFWSRSGFLFSGGSNVVRVAGLRCASSNDFRDNTFRFASKGYEPLDLSYISTLGSPAVGLFNTRKSPRPLQVYVATNQVITVLLRKEQANARH